MRYLAFISLFVSSYAFAMDDKGAAIDIASDTLEINQNRGTALFSGHVQAQHEGVKFASEELEVFYGSSNNKSDNLGTSVNRIQARTNVAIEYNGDTATGDKADYSVAKNIITLTGNVVLTQGESILKGSELVYNLKTGSMKIDSASDEKTGKGRVKARFSAPKK